MDWSRPMPEKMQIDFDEEKHEYSVNGVKVPSVSEILAPLSAERYAELNPAMLRSAAARGTAVHEACELIDYGAEPEIEPDIAGYVAAYYDFLQTYKPKWEKIEQIVCAYKYLPFGYPDEDNVLFCGTLDRYGIIDGKPAVLDIKTYASLTTDSLIQASCQTAMYYTAVAEEKMEDLIANRYVLHLKKDGSWRLVNLGRFDMERGFDSAVVANELVHLWWELDAARKAKKRGKNSEAR